MPQMKKKEGNYYSFGRLSESDLGGHSFLLLICADTFNYILFLTFSSFILPTVILVILFNYTLPFIILVIPFVSYHNPSV